MMNYQIYQTVLMVVALVGLSALTLAFLAVTIWPYLVAAWDTIGRKRIRMATLVMVVLGTMYGGSKQVIGKITFPRVDPEVWYLMDAGSAVSNDCVHVRFTRNPILPVSANIFMDGMEVAYTNYEDWAEHSFPAYSNRIDQLLTNGFDLPWPDATNYNWAVYTDWTPSPIIHTNGVAFILWQTANSTNSLVTYRTGVYTNAVRLAPNPWITNSPPMPAIQLMNSPTPTEANNED